MTDPFLVALANCPVFGSRSLEKLLGHFPSARAAWQADEGELCTLDLKEQQVNLFCAFRKTSDPSVFIDGLQKNNIRMITKDDAEYPPLLKSIFDPPFVLFIQGAQLRTPAVAIVGSRRNTEYGERTALYFAETLAARGVSIVSGLAEGIDISAHRGALQCGGHTVAVLGGGLLRQTSREKATSAQTILEKNGTVLSEFPLYGSFARYHFPMRNRIIAGMSNVTLIVEAGLPSGSLITAKAALEAGRDVFAIPGSIEAPTSAGTNQLLKDGAGVATSPDDILFVLDLLKGTKSSNATTAPARPLPPLTPLPSEVYRALERGSRFADELTAMTGSSAEAVSRALLELELLGLIRDLGGTRYERIF